MQVSYYGIISTVIMLVLTIYSILSTYIEHKKWHFIHEASLAIILGFIVGLVFISVGQHQITFSKELFFYVLLPIIVFKEGYSMNKHHFFKNFFYVALYGIIGTLFNFIFIAALTYLVNKYNLIEEVGGKINDVRLEPYAISFYSACISSKDSSLVLSLLNFKQRPKLYSIMFGEQMLNDLVVFSLQKAVQQLNLTIDDEYLENWHNYLLLFGLLLEQIVVSIFVGLLIGLAFTWITKKFRFLVKHQSICTALTIYSGYISFALCESFGFSGVVSVLLTGAIMSHYLTYNFSMASSNSSKVTVNALAYICEAFIYIYLGFAFIGFWETPPLNDQRIYGTGWSYTLILFEFFLIIPVSRLLSLVLSHVLAITCRLKTRSKWRINRYEFLIIFYSGLIRGPVAYALIQDSVITSELDMSIIQSTTIAIVIASTLFIAGSLKYMLSWSFDQIEKDPRFNKDHPSIKEDLFRGSVSKAVFDVVQYKKFTSKAQTIFQRWDEQYLKPLLIYDYKERKDDIKLAKKEHRKKEKYNLTSEHKLFDESVRNRMTKEKMCRNQIEIETSIELRNEESGHDNTQSSLEVEDSIVE